MKLLKDKSTFIIIFLRVLLLLQCERSIILLSNRHLNNTIIKQSMLCKMFAFSFEMNFSQNIPHNIYTINCYKWPDLVLPTYI